MRVNELDLEFQLLSHTSYPSLNSMAGVLDRFAIENYALDIPRDIDTLDLLPNSFLTVVEANEHDGFATIGRQSNGFQLPFDGNKKKLTFRKLTI